MIRRIYAGAGHDGPTLMVLECSMCHSRWVTTEPSDTEEACNGLRDHMLLTHPRSTAKAMTDEQLRLWS